MNPALLQGMKTTPRIEKVMTPMPHTVGTDIPLKTAYSLMKENQIRHLPVLKGGKLVGILTDRDVKLASSFKSDGELSVEDVMTSDPYAVSPQASLVEVLDEMAEHKYGAVVVRQENEKVVGIFTAVDALRLAATMAREHYKPL
jgi:CBS domain-containing protein